ncbi:MAG TPA: hypothetical protein VFS00_01500 [Polyangiaceae bacterium]|nr:hypothetical protein [Polyangiaceae bacterium]
MTFRPIAAALALGLVATPAASAPMDAGVEPVTVLGLDSPYEFDFAAKTLTNALRQRVLDAPEYTLGGQSPMLYLVALEARCSLKPTPGQPRDERSFDEACLRKMAKYLVIKRFFWGFVAADGGRPVVRLHFWQEGQPDRVASLPYDEAKREQVAERLYRKLVAPGKVGDVAVSGQADGELFIDGRSAGSYVAGVELTLPVGEHELEVRQGSRVVARGRASVLPVGRTEARLDAVVTPATPTATPPDHDPPPIVVRPKASTWPWVLGGVGVAGLAGAGALWGLRRGELNGLDDDCYGRACPRRQREAVDRADRYGTFAAVSLGVGLAAGASLATYLVVAKRTPRMVGTFVPVAGGAAFGVEGRF